MSTHQRLRLEVQGREVNFYHDDHRVGIFSDPAGTFTGAGCVAFDRQDGTPTFWDDQGAAHVIVEQDTWPRRGGPISPLVIINLSNINAERVSCNNDFYLVAVTADHVSIRLNLAEHESARIRIVKVDNNHRRTR